MFRDILSLFATGIAVIVSKRAGEHAEVRGRVRPEGRLDKLGIATVLATGDARETIANAFAIDKNHVRHRAHAHVPCFAMAKLRRR